MTHTIFRLSASWIRTVSRHALNAKKRALRKSQPRHIRQWLFPKTPKSRLSKCNRRRVRTACRKRNRIQLHDCFSDATIAPLSSDQAVNFYDEKLSDNPQKDKEELKAKYTFAEGNPFKAAKDGYIDAVIDAREVKPYVASALSMLL